MNFSHAAKIPIVSPRLFKGLFGGLIYQEGLLSYRAWGGGLMSKGILLFKEYLGLYLEVIMHMKKYIVQLFI